MATTYHVCKHYPAVLVLLDLYFVNCQLHIENVALSGTCNMTERYERSGDCTEAIDNVTDNVLDLEWNGGAPNCIHTTGSTQTGCFPFWQVVLNEEYTITNITIYNRARYQRRLTYTDVAVNGILCKSFGSNVSTIQDVNIFQCSSPIHGRTVTISRHYPTCTSDDITLNLCEVQVWVCSKGWHGNDCNTPCSGHCSNNATCDRYNGSCPQGCISGWYGSRCDYNCPQNCRGACSQSSGTCTECKDTYYGPDCREKCGNCYWVDSCNKTNGHCSECIKGWKPPLCTTAVVYEPCLCNSDGWPVEVVVGSAFAGAAVVTIGGLLCFIVYRWKRNSRRNQAKGREQSVSKEILTDLRVQYSSGPRKEETHNDEAKHSETTYDLLERSTMYENIKEHSLYTGLSIDNKSKTSAANK